MPTLHSHTITYGLFIFNGVREPQAVCQVAQADPQAKTWRQRVSAPPHNRQTINTKDRRAAANSGNCCTTFFL